MNEHLYTPKQLSTLHGVSQQTLLQWENHGKLKADRTAGGHRRYWYSIVTVFSARLRPLVMRSDSDLREKALWLGTNLRNGNITHFDVGFRSKRAQTSQSIRVNKKTFDLDAATIFPTRLKNKKHLRFRKRDIEKLKALQTTNGTVDGIICDTFQNIFLPRFEVADMVVGSPLGHSVTRKMLQLSHGYFREKLIKVCCIQASQRLPSNFYSP